MLIWTITTAFSGVYQSLSWLDNDSGSAAEQRLVWTLLALSIAGMIGNVSVAVISCFLRLRLLFCDGCVSAIDFICR